MSRAATVVIAGVPHRYQIIEYLARGSHGDVVEAINRDRNSTAVALKLLRAEGRHEDVARLMFKREVEALKGVTHDAIVQIFDYFEGDEGVLGIELELVARGESLTTLLEHVRTGRMARPSPDWRIAQAVRLADAVATAHRRNIIHRDIKPGNVLWNPDEETLKLADFGIAAVLALTAREPSGGTLRSFFSPPYASPEQMLQRAPQFSSDVYSFGLLVAALLALREPAEDFEAKELPGFLDAVGDELTAGGVSVSDRDALVAALCQSLHAEPAQRPSLSELQDVLQRLLVTFRPKVEATFQLTNTARNKLQAAGFISEAKILDDFNTGLRIRLERDDKGEYLRLYGRTLFAVVRPDASRQDELWARDAGQNAGPIHESHRREAHDCDIRLRLGRGTGAPLLTTARERNRELTVEATRVLVERARTIIALERERLPVFALQGTVRGGHRTDLREHQLGRAAGHAGAQAERVRVAGSFRLHVRDPRAVLGTRHENLVRATLQADGVTTPEPELIEEPGAASWHTLFDDLLDVEIIDQDRHLVGRVTRFDQEASELHVISDKPRKLLVRGTYTVKNRQKERQLRQQETALDALRRGEGARGDLAVLLGESSVHRLGAKPWVELMQPGLIPADRIRDIVDRILASQTMFCLQGPPGTGKTTIIAEVVAQALERDPTTRILICSQANDAVANAIERVLAVREKLGRDWIVVRDVRAERAREEGPWAGFENAYRAFVERIKSSSLNADVAQPVAEAIEEWTQSVEHGSHHVEDDYRELVQVWGTTTARSTAPLQALDDADYDFVIIDEAAKATLGEVLVPIVRGRRFLLVGDQKQLPPFLESTTTKALEELGITEAQAKFSLFEHLLTLLPSDHRDMLDTQFRMHPSIGGLVSRLFYGGVLKNGPNTTVRPLPDGDFNRDHRVMWIDVVGKDYLVGTSRANDDECAVIERLLDRLDRDATRADQKLTVAVIAAYRAQADRLQRTLHDAPRRWPALRDVKAATVDAFQGREADVVVYSLVRTGDAPRTFMADGRRFNVALSRARSLLILVGDRTGARSTPILADLLDYIPVENQLSAETIVPRRR